MPVVLVRLHADSSVEIRMQLRVCSWSALHAPLIQHCCQYGIQEAHRSRHADCEQGHQDAQNKRHDQGHEAILSCDQGLVLGMRQRADKLLERGDVLLLADLLGNVVAREAVDAPRVLVGPVSG